VREVDLIIAPPGEGKTRGVIDLLSSAPVLGAKRIGFCAERIDDLLHFEYVINHCVDGIPAPDSRPGLAEPRLPGKDEHKKTWDFWLPSEVKNLSAEGQNVWSERRFKETIQNARSFFINATHPLEDERLAAVEDEDGELRPPAGYSRWDHPDRARPRAVAKFKAQAGLCLLGLNSKELREPDCCNDCPMVSCRANTSGRDTPGKVAGARTYWETAQIGMLSHSAYQLQAAFKPSLNEFDSIVFDEVPSNLVYRYPKIRVYPLSPAAPRSPWGLDVLIDGKKWMPLTEALAAGTSVEDNPVLDTLHAVTRKLGHQAQNVRTRAAAGEHPPYSRRVETAFEPLLSQSEFETLVKERRDLLFDAEDIDEDAASRKEYVASYALQVLRDFCSDTAFPVFLEHTFPKSPKGDGQMTICRPVNGWPDLLGHPEGRRRHTLVLDATAGIDPRYDLLGRAHGEVAPRATFRNATVVFYNDGELKPSKTRVRQSKREALAEHISEVVEPYLQRLASDWLRDTKLLVLAAQEMEEDFAALVGGLVRDGRLPTQTAVAHFGGLRGKNDFRDFDAVYFIHEHRFQEDAYVGLDLLLRNFNGYPRTWVSKNDARWRKNSDLIRLRSMVCDIYQDALRIGLRGNRDRRCFIFAPSNEDGLVARLMRLFRGARFVLPTEALPAELPAAAPVQQVASTSLDPIAQQPAVPEEKAADPAPVTEPAGDFFGEPSFEEEFGEEEPVAAPVARQQPTPVEDPADAFIREFGDHDEPVAPAPVAPTPAPGQTFQVTSGIIQQVIWYAAQRLRRDGQHTQRRQSWIEGRDIPALIEELAQGRPVTEKILNDVVVVLALRTIDACPPPHPRAGEIDLVERFVFSHLSQTYPEDEAEAEKLRQQVLAATTRDQILAAIDAVTGRSEFGRADEAACTVIRSVIPEWEPAPVEVEADPGSNV